MTPNRFLRAPPLFDSFEVSQNLVGLRALRFLRRSIDVLDRKSEVFLEFDEEALGYDAVAFCYHAVPLDPGLLKIVKVYAFSAINLLVSSF